MKGKAHRVNGRNHCRMLPPLKGLLFRKRLDQSKSPKNTIAALGNMPGSEGNRGPPLKGLLFGNVLHLDP